MYKNVKAVTMKCLSMKVLHDISNSLVQTLASNTNENVQTLKVDAVCRFATHDRIQATGVLLFGDVILTAAEWLSKFYNDSDEHLSCPIYVQFGNRNALLVDRVVGFEYNTVYNWALVRVVVTLTDVLPAPIINQCGLRDQRRVTCHVNYTSVYIAEPCVNVTNRSWTEEPDDPIQYITARFNSEVQLSHYNTLAGSVLYDDSNMALGIHTGVYKTQSSEGHCVVEYGQSIGITIERFVLQFLIRRRFDDLSAYLRADERFDIRRAAIKDYVVYNDLKQFKTIVNESSSDDETLQQFFRYFNTSGEITNEITNVLILMQNQSAALRCTLDDTK